MTALPHDIETDTDYQDAVEAARRLVETESDCKWGIGDIAVDVQSVYGKDTIGQFALDIQYAKATVQDYRRVSSYWTATDRQEFTDIFPWSVFRITKRFDDVEDAKAFLRECQDNNKLTVDAVKHQMIERLGESKSNHAQMWGRVDFLIVHSADGRLILGANNVHPDLIADLKVGMTVDAKLYEVNNDD